MGAVQCLETSTLLTWPFCHLTRSASQLCTKAAEFVTRPTGTLSLPCAPPRKWARAEDVLLLNRPDIIKSQHCIDHSLPAAEGGRSQVGFFWEPGRQSVVVGRVLRGRLFGSLPGAGLLCRVFWTPREQVDPLCGGLASSSPKITRLSSPQGPECDLFQQAAPIKQ